MTLQYTEANFIVSSFQVYTSLWTVGDFLWVYVNSVKIVLKGSIVFVLQTKKNHIFKTSSFGNEWLLIPQVMQNSSLLFTK